MFNGDQLNEDGIEFETRPVIFNIEGRHIPIVFDIAPTHDYQLIIGNEWLMEFDPNISWKTHKFRWRDVKPVFEQKNRCLARATDI